MKIIYKKLLKGYWVLFKGGLVACDKDRITALSKALTRIKFIKQ